MARTDGKLDKRAAEAARIDEVKARAAVPECCGPSILPAPARPRLIPFMPKRVELRADGTTVEISDGYHFRMPGRLADVFDKMEAARLAKDRRAGRLFSTSQVATGRHYAALVERCAGSGVRGQSLEAMSGRGGQGGDGGFMDAVIRDSRELAAMQARIGDGVALAVRRARAGRRASRVGIKDRYLVDRVCLSDWTLTEVMTRCGWANDASARRVLLLALCAALDRMTGYR